MLGRACRETRDIEGLRVSVNAPPVQFSHPDFERQVRRVLDAAGLAPELLLLEITERHLIDDPERARRAIDSLRAIGVGFAPDDFNAGFTSLACLQFHGFTCVKIDRSLTKRLQTEQKAGHLICGLVHLAKGLDLRVVAEGVEDERLAQMLKMAGCNELQGYHFGRPAPLAQALNMAAPPKQEIALV
jgi:EAL domain-containing protein (putative c-di-GMP-specific phosphodiesterase class I)